MLSSSSNPAEAPAATTIVAIGASAGGIAAISTVLSGLPAHLAAAVLVEQHLYPHGRSFLPEILGRITEMSVIGVQGGERLVHGYVYVAPPDWHMVVTPHRTLRLLQSARVHFVRPSADRLFESLLQGGFERVIGVVLTGSGSDGRDGAHQVRQHGGVIIAQDEETSEHFGMPGACAREGDVDHVLPLNEIAGMIRELSAA